MTESRRDEDDTFRFLCPHCLATLRASGSLEGETVACPGCEEPVTVTRENEVGAVQSDFPMLDTLNQKQKDGLELERFDDAQKKILNEWAFAVYNAGEQAAGEKAVGKITRLLPRERTVLLDDASRWQLAEATQTIPEAWQEEDRVAVIDGEMHNLENAETVSVVRP
jgi:hypothetical protein